MTSSSAGPTSPLLPYQPVTSTRADRIHPQTLSRGYQDHTAYALAEQQREEVHRRTQSRFWKALAVGIICYLLLTAFIGSMMVNIEYPRIGEPLPPLPPNAPPNPDSPKIPRPNPTDRDQPPGAPPERRPWPGPEDGQIIQCFGEDSWSPNPLDVPFITTNMNDMTWSSGPPDEELPYTVYNMFTLPVDVNYKAIFSKGRHASGTFRLRTREADDDEDNIRILIQASYRYQEALECQICSLKRHNGGRSLGIYTSDDFDGSKDIRFTIEVLFPRNRALTSSPRDMGTFAASLSWFDYTIATLDEVYFQSLTLVTASDKMHSKGVVADKITLVTNNGDVTGNFNVTDEIAISTSNAKIDVDLNVSQIDDEKPSKVTLSTNNAPVIARNKLYHPGAQGGSSGGNFTMVVSTKNASVDISYGVAPVDSILNCVVSTSNADAKVHLHPTYEGDVTLTTSNGQTSVHQADGIEDPSGQGRERLVAWKHMWRWWLIGWIGWGEKKQAGSLVVSSSNGRIYLYM